MEIRASILPSYADCSKRAFANLYIKTLKEFGYVLNSPSLYVGSAIGTATHKGFSSDLIGIRDGDLKSKDDVLNIGIDKYRQLSVDGIGFDSVTNNSNLAENQIQQILKMYLLKMHSKMRPEYVEHEFKVKYKGHIITGHPDLIDLGSVIVDFKTGFKRNPYQSQTGIYGKLYEARAKKPCKGMTIVHIPRRKDMTNPKINIYNYNVEISKSIALRTIDRIISDYEIFIETECPNHIPENPMSFLCSRKYCLAHGTDFCEITI